MSVGETGAEQRRPVTASKHLGNGRKVLCARLPEGNIDASYAEPFGDITEADVEYPRLAIELKQHVGDDVERPTWYVVHVRIEKAGTQPFGL